MDGYELVTYTEEVLGSTGKPGLGGRTGSEAWFPPPRGEGRAAASTQLK